ncbi:MDR family MFS transporter [Aspergillus puulaauensis]|uniref:Major facilitator superfamily (MFS) profile domain-containing protein n=1 Tax=Aspergillus puulaauensis TaxID=1220207 RepID=A0A7R7XZV9_9EURO|nr:uncharacterized protein APUU_80002S [Aspergillus puulaauensis]BCS29699.1 hypothetical protein APUU_80002S [Aspergillus puulaauensis]
MFCMSLDETILATAMPRITDEFQSLGDVGWYRSSYLFVLAAVQMIWGKLYTLYPTKWIFLLGLVIFELGSLVCGLAPSSGALIGGRVVAGLGAGSIEAGTVIIIMDTVPLRKRPIYLGVLGCVHGIATVAGPLLGGALTDHVTWRWCFYINLPLGSIAFLIILTLLRTKSNTPSSSHLSAKEKLMSMDLLGALFFTPAVITLLLALQYGGSEYSWGNWRIIVLFTLSALLLATFAGVQIWAKERASIPPDLLCNRNMLAVIWYSTFSHGALFVFTYYLPLWFQAVKGATATTSGLEILPTELGLVVTGLGAGVLVSIIGFHTPFMIVSSVISSIGAGMLSTLYPTSGLGPCLGYQLLLSVGLGLGIQNTMLVPQVEFIGDNAIMAISMLAFLETLSASISLAIGDSVFRNRLETLVQEMVPSVNASILTEGTALVQDNIPPALLPSVLAAYSLSITETFYIGVAMCALSFLGSVSLQWKSIKDEMPTDTATRRCDDTRPAGDET